MKSDKEFKHWIREKKELRSKKITQLYNTDPADIHQVYAYRTLHTRCHIVAAYNLILGDAEESRRWYAESALYNHRWITLVERHFDDLDPEMTYRLTMDIQETLFRTLMAGDPEIIATVAPDVVTFDESVLPDRERFPEREHRVRTLAALLQDDEEAAETHLEKYRNVLESPEKGHPFDQHFATTLDGLLADDPPLVREGIAKLTRYHEDIVDEPGDVDEELAAPAAAFVRLADHRGIEVHVDSPFLPETLWELEWGPVELPDEVYEALDYVDRDQ